MRVMKLYKTLFFFSLLNAFAVVLIVHAQEGQSGFISLDCGLPLNSNYTEPTTELKYISDVPFITTGSSHSIAPEYKTGVQEQVKNLRSFPEGIRNCYRVNVTKGTRYLIRATFFHGNYDNQNTAPEFDLHLGVNLWTKVTFINVSISSIREIIHLASRDFLHVCLVNIGSGTPFISALEFRPFSSNIYNYTATSGYSESLALLFRLDIGSTTDLAYRYPYDFYDRSWLPYNGKGWTVISTTKYPQSQRYYRPPAVVMSTAATPINESDPLEFSVFSPNQNADLYFYMYFTETQLLQPNQSRLFNVIVNGELWFEDIAPLYRNTTTIFSTSGNSGFSQYNFSLVKLQNSTLPPILNAFEVFYSVDVSHLETDINDVNTITNVKSTYGVKRNWDGDPCAPVEYSWSGLNCSYNDFDPPMIISLNLSSSGLTGNVTTHISKLSRIQSLDLSNNNLTGPVPEFLTRLPNLRVLNLRRNNLTGSIPIKLIEKSNRGLLSLSVGENPHLCVSSKCENTEKKKRSIVPILASVLGGLVVTLLIAVAVFVGLKMKKTQDPSAQKNAFESSKRQFSYSEIIRITNNFERVLGKGGFGTVYHGLIDENTQVAVKVLSSTSVQGYQQFQAEVQLLMKVYHRNLTSLVGYCNEGDEMALIYEYMANGDLSSHLSGDSNTNVLSWEGRIRIAMDAAQGLEYMHFGCKPPIVHRDVKTTNILLTENFQAKLADFGLSRVFPTDTGTHVSTVVAGTPGYLDPAYHITNRLNETSDIYSYGVVLLEIITNQPAIIKVNESTDDERIHISRWVSSTIDNGAITSIVDPRLQGGFDNNSAWKAVEIGMACVSPTPRKRPNMSEVVNGLKECLAMELARNNHGRLTNSSLDVSTEISPLAR